MSSRRTLTIALAGSALVASGLTVMTPAHAAPAASGVTHEQNDRVPQGASWTQSYFPSAGGAQLHADVLRPAGLPADAKTPVILSIGPYFSHAGQTGNDGFSHTGPSARFNDLINGAQLMARGYTVVLVDLRGFGGSTGCLDWVGPGEQADVSAAIDWSRTQPWSTGKVGMYGKSYDASTGLVGVGLGRGAPDAVVAQEPVWDMYNYLFNNGVARYNHSGTPQAYNGIATTPPMADDTPQYRANAQYEKSHPQCLTSNLTDTQDPNHDSAYWRPRDLVTKATGSTVPLFVTQGTLENNTRPEDMERFLANHTGPERGWIGPWEHVRGNETTDAGVLKMGRQGWFNEVMAFYDQYLKGEKPSQTTNFAIEDNTGTWRAQSRWPTPTVSRDVKLASGNYLDNGDAGQFGPGTAAARGKNGAAGKREDMERATAPRSTKRALSAASKTSITTFSQPVKAATRLTGTPRIDLQTKGRGNVVAELWDVAPDGTAVQLNDMISVLDQDGSTSFDLRGMDWLLQPGHQLGVRVGTNYGDGYWVPSVAGHSSNATVQVTKARLRLDLQNTRYDVPTQGGRAPWLDTYLREQTAAERVLPGKGSFPLQVPPGRH